MQNSCSTTEPQPLSDAFWENNGLPLNLNIWQHAQPGCRSQGKHVLLFLNCEAPRHTLQLISSRHQANRLHFRNFIFFCIGDIGWESSSPTWTCGKPFLLLPLCGRWLRHCNSVSDILLKGRKQGDKRGNVSESAVYRLCDATKLGGFFEDVKNIYQKTKQLQTNVRILLLQVPLAIGTKLERISTFLKLQEHLGEMKIPNFWKKIPCNRFF